MLKEDPKWKRIRNIQDKIWSERSATKRARLVKRSYRMMAKFTTDKTAARYFNRKAR